MEELIPTQQMDLVNTQLVATQQQLQQLQERYNELSMHHSMLLQELIGVQKTVVNHEHVMQYVMNFLQTIDAQRRRESRIANPFAPPTGGLNGNKNQQIPPMDDDTPASPLQNAAKLLTESNADHVLNSRNLEHMNEVSLRMNHHHHATTTPPPGMDLKNGTRSSSRGEGGPRSVGSSTSISYGELDNLVYPVGQTNGIDPMYPEHSRNIPYPMPAKQALEATPAAPADGRKKSMQYDPGWIRQPRILLVEDDPTCRRIGGKFLQVFHCSVDSAVSGNVLQQGLRPVR